MVDMINHPPHYNNHPSGVECIEITKHMNYCLGNAIKYIWRADLKNDAVEDLKKAIFYLNSEIERRNGTNKEERPREIDFPEYPTCNKSVAAEGYFKAYNEKRGVRDSEY